MFYGLCCELCKEIHQKERLATRFFSQSELESRTNLAVHCMLGNLNTVLNTNRGGNATLAGGQEVMCSWSILYFSGKSLIKCIPDCIKVRSFQLWSSPDSPCPRLVTVLFVSLRTVTFFSLLSLALSCSLCFFVVVVVWFHFLCK